MKAIVDGVPVVVFDGLKTTPKPPRKIYENYTFIDWANESIIKGATAHKWLTIMVTSLLVGYITSFVDLLSVWLNDLKKGWCFSKIDQWSLLNPYLTCPADDWYDWLRILFDYDSKVVDVLVNFPIYLVVASVWVLLAAWLSFGNPLIKQLGIPEIKLIIAGFNYDLDHYLGVLTLFTKTLALSLVVALGAWLGKEGPLVHVACCILNSMYKLFFMGEHEGLRRELLIAAVATGISVAFDSPIGGVLFVVELLPSYFMPTKIMWNSFVSATIAVIILTGFKIFTNGLNFLQKDLFSVNFGNFSWLFMETVPFVFLGVLGGVYGHLYTKLNLYFTHYQLHKRLASVFHISIQSARFAEALLVIAATTILNFPLSISRLPLDAYLKSLFTECLPDDTDHNSANFMCLSSDPFTVFKLSYILLQGTVLSAYTFSLTLPGGVLMPSLVLGATTGRLVGIVSQALQSMLDIDYLSTCTAKTCVVSPSSYAVVGAGAFMLGITKLTMCVVVIIFELTGAVSYVLPIMLGVMTAKFVNDRLCNENIYDSWLREVFNRNVEGEASNPSKDINNGKGNGLVAFSNATPLVKVKCPDVPISHAMVQFEHTKCLELLPTVPHTLTSLLKFLADEHEGYPFIVSRSDPLHLGYVNKQDLFGILLGLEDSHTSITFVMDSCPPDVASQQLLYEQSLGEYLHINVEVERLLLVVNPRMPLVLVLDMFEKLSLNYLIITDNDVVKGLVDRFILARLVQLRFAVLQQAPTWTLEATEFDIESEDELPLMGRGHHSIELIS